jgi:hypothetical protein
VKTRSSSKAGFSLVEIALALGVVVFCMVTIMGLLAVSVTTTHTSSFQTTAANTLNAIAADLVSTPNSVTSNINPTFYKGYQTEQSPVYGITLPQETSPVPSAFQPPPTPTLPPNATATTTPTTSSTFFYIGDDGSHASSISALTAKPGVTALYQVNVWITPPGKNNALTNPAVQQETFVRLLLTWPPEANYLTAQGSMEQVVALNRTSP